MLFADAIGPFSQNPWKCGGIAPIVGEVMSAKCVAMEEARLPRGVADQAYRSLQFVQVIEAAVSNAASNGRFLSLLANEVRKKVEAVDAYDGSDLVDPTGSTCGMLEQAALVASRLYDTVRDQHASAVADHRLTDEDGVADAFAEYLAAAADFHNALEDLRDRIATVDALKSPRGQAFTSVEDLFASLTA